MRGWSSSGWASPSYPHPLPGRVDYPGTQLASHPVPGRQPGSAWSGRSVTNRPEVADPQVVRRPCPLPQCVGRCRSLGSHRPPTSAEPHLPDPHVTHRCVQPSRRADVTLTQPLCNKRLAGHWPTWSCFMVAPRLPAGHALARTPTTGPAGLLARPPGAGRPTPSTTGCAVAVPVGWPSAVVGLPRASYPSVVPPRFGLATARGFGNLAGFGSPWVSDSATWAVAESAGRKSVHRV